MYAFSCSRAVDVTPNDTTPVSFGTAPPNPPKFRRLFVGTGGTISLITVGGDTVSYTVTSGSYLWVEGTIVKATGTSATNIVAEY